MTDSSSAVPGPGRSEPAAFRRYFCSVLRCRAYFERVTGCSLELGPAAPGGSHTARYAHVWGCRPGILQKGEMSPE